MHDIIIIGAGVAGCACARELSRYNADILVLEKEEDVCCGTSKANSAIVHAGYDAANGSLMAQLNVEGSRRMPALAKELDFAYDQCGSLVVCLSEDDRPRCKNSTRTASPTAWKGCASSSATSWSRWNRTLPTLPSPPCGHPPAASSAPLA